MALGVVMPTASSLPPSSYISLIQLEKVPTNWRWSHSSGEGKFSIPAPKKLVNITCVMKPYLLGMENEVLLRIKTGESIAVHFAKPLLSQQ